MDGIYRSEMQILNAVPGSKDQSWHSDNRKRGLSIIVPLVDFTADNGGTQMLVGSHNSSWSLVAQEGAVLRVDVRSAVYVKRRAAWLCPHFSQSRAARGTGTGKG